MGGGGGKEGRPSSAAERARVHQWCWLPVAHAWVRIMRSLLLVPLGRVQSQAGSGARPAHLLLPWASRAATRASSAAVVDLICE